MKSSMTLLAGVMAVFASVNPSKAEVVKVVYTGVVASNFGQNSAIFGSIAKGRPYTATFTFDLGANDTKIRTPDQNADYGGTFYGNESPNVSTTFTLNGMTISFQGSFGSIIQGINDPEGPRQSHYARANSNTELSMYILGESFGTTLPLEIDQPFSYTVSSNDVSGGRLIYQGDDFGVEPLTVTETIVATVPLPASAPMFGAALLALGGFGYSMNRWVAPKGKKAAAAA